MNFKFLNIPVHIHPSFWIFVLIFTRIYQNPSVEKLLLAAIIFFSLIVHEFGHALTARYFGAMPVVILEAFGGKAVFNSYGMSLKQKFLITLNGPLIESFLIVLPYSILKMGTFDHHPHITYFLQMTMYLNLWWCLMNLLPIMPLDGGQLLRYFLEMKFGEKGFRASLWIGIGCAVVVLPFFIYHQFVVFSILMAIFGYQNFKALKSFQTPSEGDNPFNAYMKGVEAIKNNDLEKAKTLLKKLLQSKDPQIKHSAIESLAKVYFQESDKKKSYDLLLTADPESLKEGKVLLCKLAFEQGHYGLTCKYSRDTYATEPTFEVAAMNSQAFAHLNHPELAAGWLETASQFGPEYREKVEQLLQLPAYDSVRDHEAFKSHLEKIALKI